VISPDVAEAVAALKRDGVLAPEQARLFGRVARGELVSLHAGLQVLLYLGVLAVTSGVGLLFKDQIQNLGPLTIAAVVALAAGLCLVWVAQTCPPFTRAAVVAPHFMADTALNLGALLAAADLAYIENRFAPLGPNWSYHLLVVSIFYSGLAFRFDSRSLFGLSLTTFAAWRGVAATSVERSLFGFFDDANVVRLNALACGLAFVIIGGVLLRRRLKAHFEPIATYIGWLLILQSIAWGIDSGEWRGLHRLVLIGVGSGLALYALRSKRFGLFFFGVLAAYVGLMVVVGSWARSEKLGLFLFAGSSLALIAALARVHHRFRSESEE